jgi:hypothetical protein
MDREDGARNTAGVPTDRTPPRSGVVIIDQETDRRVPQTREAGHRTRSLRRPASSAARLNDKRLGCGGRGQPPRLADSSALQRAVLLHTGAGFGESVRTSPHTRVSGGWIVLPPRRRDGSERVDAH